MKIIMTIISAFTRHDILYLMHTCMCAFKHTYKQSHLHDVGDIDDDIMMTVILILMVIMTPHLTMVKFSKITI